MRVIGYLRVSTADRDLANCKNRILHFANEKRLGSVTWIEETVSGTVDWKQRERGAGDKPTFTVYSLRCEIAGKESSRMKIP